MSLTRWGLYLPGHKRYEFEWCNFARCKWEDHLAMATKRRCCRDSQQRQQARDYSIVGKAQVRKYLKWTWTLFTFRRRLRMFGRQWIPTLQQVHTQMECSACQWSKSCPPPWMDSAHIVLFKFLYCSAICLFLPLPLFSPPSYFRSLQNLSFQFSKEVKILPNQIVRQPHNSLCTTCPAGGNQAVEIVLLRHLLD